MNRNLARLLSDTAHAHGDAPALFFQDGMLSYAALDDLSARVAGILTGRGVRAGDRVGVMLPNVAYFAAVYYGILRAGAVVVPMNPLLKRNEIAYYLGDSQAVLVFAWHGFADEAASGAAQAGAAAVVVAPGQFEQLLAEAPPMRTMAVRQDTDTAVILYTSGTTGRPKGAELTHANLVRNADVSRRLFSIAPGDVVLGALPLFHSFGQTCGLNATVAAGAALALVPRFEPGPVLATIQRHGVSVFEGVPTMYAALLNYADRGAYDVSALRLSVSGGAALPVEVLRAFEEAFGCVILEGYGLSETSPVASFNHPDRERKPGSIGTPVEGVQMRVVDETGREVPGGEVGEISIRGHNVMQGYWRRPAETAEVLDDDGWFRTGDVARVDEDGFFFIVDRKKDLIIRCGYNVYPREIEEVLYSHPAVGECAVIGIPHAELGEEIGAAVALKPGASATQDELRDFVKEQVAAYKYPRRIWFLAELPKGPTGKLLKREIRVPGGVSTG